MTCVMPFTIPDRWIEVQTPAVRPETTASTCSTRRATRRQSRRLHRARRPGELHRLQRRPRQGLARPPQGRQRHQDRAELLLPLRDATAAPARSDYRWNIGHCNTTVMEFGQTYDSEPGNMVGPTRQGMDDLIALDPRRLLGRSRTIVWSARSTRARASSPSRCSTRPTTPTASRTAATPRSSSSTISASSSNEMQGNEVVGRITPIGGLRKGNGGPAPAAAFPKVHSAGSVGHTMAQLTAQVVSYDDEFKRQVAAPAPRLRRSGRHRRGAAARKAPGPTWSSSTSAPTPRRAWRRSSGCARAARALAIFAIAAAAEPDLILQAMRAGANEFFPWTPVERHRAARATEESFHGAVRRTAARREAATAGRQAALRHARVSRRQGRRRHDDRRGELRRRAGAAHQAADRRSSTSSPVSARSRCFSACGRGSPCSTRSRTCTASTRTS